MPTVEGKGSSCQSVLKGQTAEAVAAALTQGWIELINRLERQRTAVLPRKGAEP